MVPPTSRRNYLKAIGIGSAASLAGCLGGGSDGNGSSSSGSGGSGGSNGSGNTEKNSSDSKNGGGSGGKSRDLKIATPFNTEHTQTKLASRFADNVKSATNGRITFSVLAASIGGEEDQIEAVASGSVDMHGTSISSIATAYGKEYGFLEAPFVAQDWDHFVAMQKKYTYGDNGFNQQIIKQGNQRQINQSLRGFRGTTSNIVVKKPEDVQGVKMRLPQFDTWVKTWQEIGVKATPVAFDELYSALESGVVKASEGPIQQFMDTSLYEVQSNFSQTQHLLQGLSWLVNEKLWQDLSSDDQKVFKDSLNEAIKWANEKTRSETDTLLKKAAEEHGTTITHADEVDHEAFLKAGQPQLKKFFKNRWKPSYQEVKELAKNSN